MHLIIFAGGGDEHSPSWDVQKLQTHKIKTVDISILTAKAISRIHNKDRIHVAFVSSCSFED